MELKNFYPQDPQGNVIPGATVYLYLPGTTTLATGLQNETGGALTNPWTGSSITGKVTVAAPDGDYDLRMVGGGRDSTLRVRFIDSDTGSVHVLRQDLGGNGGAQLIGFDPASTVSQQISGINEKMIRVALRGDGLPDLGVNSAPVAGILPGFRSPSQELESALNSARLIPPDLGVCAITPAAEVSTLVAPSLPFLTHRGVTSRYIPIHILTRLHNTPVSLPLFRPKKTNGWGWLTWQYIGSEPIHVQIAGSIDCLVRTSGPATQNSDATQRILLRLRSWDHPNLENGENSAGRVWSYSNPLEGAATELPSYRGCEDYNRVIDASAITNSLTNAELWVSSSNGYFLANSTAETLLTTESGNPVGAEVKTTAWIDVSSYQRRALLFNLTGTSTRSRVQVKTSTGVIYYDSQSDDISARRIYRVPPDANFIRIHYSASGDTASGESIRALSSSTGAEYNILSGHWTKKAFHASMMQTFWPGAEYALTFAVDTYNGSVARDFGYRFQSGGFHFLFDAHEMRKVIAQRAYKE